MYPFFFLNFMHATHTRGDPALNFFPKKSCNHACPGRQQAHKTSCTCNACARLRHACRKKFKQRCTTQCHRIPTPGLQQDAPPGLASFGLRHWLEMKEGSGVLFHSGCRWRVAWATPWYGNQSDLHEDVMCGNASGWAGLVGVGCLCCMSRAFFFFLLNA